MGAHKLRLRATLLLAISVSLPIGASAQVDNYTPYHELLAKECGAKHLEWVSPAGLDLLITNFHDALPEAQQSNLDRANDADTACAKVMAGVTCGNVSALRAMTKTGLLTTFAKKVCKSGMVCRGQSDCSQP
jgi:hypothetical protein